MSAPLPSWNLNTFFSGVDSEAYRKAVQETTHFLAETETTFEKLQIGEGGPLSGNAETEAALATVITQLGALSEKLRLVRGYARLLVSVDSKDEVAQGAISSTQPLAIRADQLGKRFTAWVGRLPVDALTSEVAESHRYFLTKLKFESQRLMSPAEEALASEMGATGGDAWSRFYSNFTSQLQVGYRGGKLPMSAIRTLAYDPDAQVRQDAYSAELEAWEQAGPVVASAFNAIKGEANLLAKRRGWGSLLDEAVFRANIDRDTLDAMLGAARDAFPVFRRYLRSKAKALGHSGGLPWYDLFAPLGGGGNTWEYGQAEAFVEEGFDAYALKMGDLARRSKREGWVDAAPKPGKVDGAYCSGIRGDESRILMNFKPAFGSVSTLAHELGHAYHNVCLAPRSPMQRSTPMTLAETASIFCETLIKRRALAQADGAAALAILEPTLMGATQVVVDITSRFLFESRAVEGRAARELSARELSEIMAQAQRETYGEGLTETELHPYMWAAKPHYYGGRGFYNFPYMFGLLFGLGLYADYQARPDGFQERYDSLLSRTGMADAATLAAEFGIEIREKAFWKASLDRIAEDVVRFESLV